MSQATRAASEKRYVWGVCVFLFVAVWVVYGQTLRHSLLHYDDDGFVSQNPHVKPGLTLEGIRWAFCEGPYGEWYPLAPLSHMLDCQLFGLHAWGHHLTNLLLHAAASIGLFLVLRQMTGQRAVPGTERSLAVAQVVPASGARSGTSERREGRVSGPERDNTGRVAPAGPSATTLWPSGLVAAIFAVHPQHVESVAWVAERRDVLSGLFFMLTLAAWLGYLRHGRPLWRYLLVAAMFSLGLMSKPMLVTVPPLLLLLDFWPLARFGKAGDTPEWTRSAARPGILRLVLEKLPLLALSVGDCLMTLRTHVQGTESIPWPERIGNAAVSCVIYLVQFFFPSDLCAYYPYPSGGWPAGQVDGSILILLAVSASAVIWRRRFPYCFVGWFWYLGMLSPVLGLVRVSDHAMADRYMYLPSIGLCIALSWGAFRLAARIPEGRWILGTCAGLVIALLTACAVWQTATWRDDATLWRHALACTTDNPYAETALAKVLLQQNRRDEAVEYLRRAEQHATDATPFSDLGAILAREGKLDDAIAQYRLGLAKQPDSYLALVNLAGALIQQRQFGEARQNLDHALAVNPRGTSAYIALAHLLAAQHELDQAREQLEKALQIDRYSAAAHNDLGSTLQQQGQIDEAISHYRSALAIAPNLVLAHTNLASALAALGKYDEAAGEYRQALQLDPKNRAAREGLDNLLRGGSGRADTPSR